MKSSSVSEWTPSALKYWQMPGKTLKVVVGSIGGGRSEHIGVIKRFRQDEDFHNEGVVEFEDGEKMYSTQGQWFEFSEQTLNTLPPQSGKLDRVQRITQRELDSGKEWDWALKELGWDTPEYGWTHEKLVLKVLFEESREAGYNEGWQDGWVAHLEKPDFIKDKL